MKNKTSRALSALMLMILPVSAALANVEDNLVEGLETVLATMDISPINFTPPSSRFSFLQNNRFSVSSSRNGPQTTRGIIEDNHWDDPETGETLCWTDSATDEENTPAWLQYYKARDAGGEIDLTLWQNLVFVGEVEISQEVRKWYKLPKLIKQRDFSFQAKSIYAGGWWENDEADAVVTAEFDPENLGFEDVRPLEKMLTLAWMLSVCGHES